MGGQQWRHVLAQLQVTAPGGHFRAHTLAQVAALRQLRGLGLPGVVLLRERACSQGAHGGNGAILPGGVDDAQVRALQRHRQLRGKGLVAAQLGGAGGGEGGVFGRVAFGAAGKGPA